MPEIRCHLANKYEDIVMPEQHRHLANKYEDIVNLQGVEARDEAHGMRYDPAGACLFTNFLSNKFGF